MCFFFVNKVFFVFYFANKQILLKLQFYSQELKIRCLNSTASKISSAKCLKESTIWILLAIKQWVGYQFNNLLLL